MRNHNDPMVTCPYDKAHKMPAPRLQWHLVKCKAKQERAKLGLLEYHCRYNFMHLFFTKEELEAHEKECQLEKENQRDERLEKQRVINEALQEHHSDISAGGDKVDEDNPKSELFKAYRAGQEEQRFKRFENSRADYVEQQIMRWDQSEPSENQENSDSQQNWIDPQNQQEISQDEVGSENYERFKKLPVEHQKTVKQRYFSALSSSTSTYENSDEHQKRQNSAIMPDGFQSQPKNQIVSRFDENSSNDFSQRLRAFFQDPQVSALALVTLAYLLYSCGVLNSVVDVIAGPFMSQADDEVKI